MECMWPGNEGGNGTKSSILWVIFRLDVSLKSLLCSYLLKTLFVLSILGGGTVFNSGFNTVFNSGFPFLSVSSGNF